MVEGYSVNAASVRCVPPRAPQRRRGGVERHGRGAAPPADSSRLQASAHAVWHADGWACNDKQVNMACEQGRRAKLQPAMVACEDGMYCWIALKIASNAWQAQPGKRTMARCRKHRWGAAFLPRRRQTCKQAPPTAKGPCGQG